MTNLINLVVQVSRYLMIVLMVIYTLQSYTVFRRTSVQAKEYVFYPPERIHVLLALYRISGDVFKENGYDAGNTLWSRGDLSGSHADPV